MIYHLVARYLLEKGALIPILNGFLRLMTCPWLAGCLFLGQVALGAQAHISENSGYLGLSGVSYVNPNYETDKERNIPLYTGRVNELSLGETINFGYDMEGQFSPEAESMSAFTVNELFVYGNPDWTENTLIFGRKLQSWSQLDRDLALGIIEPNYRVDPLRRHSQGLIGLFLKVDKPLATLQIFASSFYLPNQGPSMEARKGQFTKGHPWINLPPEQVLVMGEMTGVNYQIDQPNLSQVILQNSYGAMLESPIEQEGVRGKVFYFNKPNNQLALGYDGKLMLDPQDPYLDIVLHPEVVRSTIRGSELSYKTGALQGFLTVMQEEPQEYQFQSPWTYQKFTATQISGAGLKWQGPKLNTSMTFAQRAGGEVIEVGENAQANTEVLPSPYMFTKLLSFQLDYSWKFPRRENNRMVLRWDQELDENSEVISLQLDHQIEKYWYVTVGLDFLRAGKSLAGVDSSVLAQNLNNDRFFGGFNYVF